MVAVLAGAFAFVYARLRADLDDSVDTTLAGRRQAAADQFAARGSIVGFPVEDPEESFVVALDADGQVLDHVGMATTSPLTPTELAAARSGPVQAERTVAGIDGTARMLAGPVAADDAVVVAGQSLQNREEALADVRRSFGIGGPLAVLTASLLGYLLARRALTPVDEIRRTAAAISAAGASQQVPVPAAHDEVRRLAETLNGMLHRLHRSFERERRFIADASHELRTPIAVIKTELEAARLAGDHGPVAGDAVRAAIDECDRLAHLADDLLVLARDGDRGIPVTMEVVAVGDVLDDAARRFVDRAAAAGRSIVVHAPAGVLIDADPVRLRQALSNLVDNALRHGAGTVTLTGQAVADHVDLDVSDEGDGFDADIAAHAFERFTRGTHRRSAGAGLGLTIVDAIAAAHRGSASIAAAHPPTVRISLPMIVQPSSAPS
jgi:signal transduction histidine kinase